MKHEFELTILIIFCLSAAAALRMLHVYTQRPDTDWRVSLVGMATFAGCYLLLTAVFFTLGRFGLNPVGPVFDRLVNLLS